jgi:hypothetical protein
MSAPWLGQKSTPGPVPAGTPAYPAHGAHGDGHGHGPRPVGELSVLHAVFEASKVPTPTGNPRPRAPAGIFDGGPFARVRLTGAYGQGGFQSIDLGGVTREEARRAAWTWFGTSAHTLTYLDRKDNVLAAE